MNSRPSGIARPTGDVAPAIAERSVASRIWGVVLAAWAAITGLAPHVLHHVGPLAGAAFLAGAGGRLLFGGIALVVSVPFLMRIYRRFGTWVAPAIALGAMATIFSLSTFVVGPAISGESGTVDRPVDERSVLDEHGH